MLETLRSLGAGRLMIIGLVAVGFVGFFIYLTTRLTAPNFTLLYAGLDPADAAKIVAKLDGSSVPYEIKANGTEILVPSEQVAKLRMTMAQDGIPQGGTMGYEIFDQGGALGTSNFVLNINHLRALEGELARTIQSLDYVRRARVHLVLPQHRLFSRNPVEPSASVLLEMKGGRRLSPSEVAAVQQLVAAAVPGLQPYHISIVDDQGTLLARGRERGKGPVGAMTEAEAAKRTYEDELARTIQSMLERTVGPGHVRAEVSAEMNFDRTSTTIETYDPDGQVVRSTQTVEETSASKDGQAAKAVSVASSLPSANTQGLPAQAAPAGQTPEPRNSARTNRTEETVNYEISKTTKTHVEQPGSVTRLSVAVLVDGDYVKDESGNMVYKPRTPEQLAEYTRLVKSAIGFNAKRGDKVEVVNLRFAGLDQVFASDDLPRPLFGLGKNDYIRIAEMLILGIVAILVILLVVRPLIKRVLDALPEAIASSRSLINDSVAAAGGPLLPPGQVPAALPGIAPGAAGDVPNIDVGSIDSRMHDTATKRIGEIVDKHPDEAVSIIRNWMYQDS